VYPLFTEIASNKPDRPRPLVAVSACLLGHAVRYDATDKAHALIIERLLPQVELLPLCPEAGAGLGVPRPPVQLLQFDDGLSARGRDNPELDITAALTGFATAQVQQLAAAPNVCGHIFKSRSPSCGLASTPIYDRDAQHLHLGSGLYAEIISTHLPWLVFAEETTLDSAAACDNFLQQLFFVQSIRAAVSENKLAIAHRHYQSLWQASLSASSHVAQLEQAAVTGNWQDYLSLALTIISDNNPFKN
jgi:uncharacterized protein YbbK (DUF523 family)